MRKIDRKSYAITYRELEAILNRNGFYFEAPEASFINIVVRKERRRFFGLGGKETYTERVCQIMFPRWGAQVSQDTIRAVRKMTGLTNEKGVDSGVFYNGLDTMQSLITTYHRPLLSLASR